MKKTIQDKKCHKGQIQTTAKTWVKDLTGRKFGRLIVLGLNDQKKNSKWLWKCQCSCGKIVYCQASNLKNGTTRSCGCYRKELNTKDISGQKFGRLTVIRPTTKREQYTETVIWECLCDCGKICYVPGARLRNGQTRSCGCLQKDSVAQNGKGKAVKLEGIRSGLLTAIRPTERRAADGSIIWLCRCDCGNYSQVSSNAILQKATKSCGCLLSSGEKKIQFILQKEQITFEVQKMFDGCVNPKTEAKLRFDFYLPDYNCCIEYDGEQHFRPVEYFGGQKAFEAAQYRDILKNKFCENNDIKLIRIPYTDFDKIDEQYILDRIGENGE